MATLTLTSGTDQFKWSISSLGNAFNTTYYKRAGVTTSNFTDGASSISGIVSSKTAPSSGTSKSTGTTTVTYSPGTYTLYGFAQAKNGNYYKSGSGTVTVKRKLASFSLSSTATSITVTVTVSSDYGYYRIFCRETDDTSGGSYYPSTTYQSKTSTWTYTISGLTPNTSYTVNVQCATSSSGANATYVGAKTISTSGPTTSFTLSTSGNAIDVSVVRDSSYRYNQLSWKKSSASSYPTANYYPSSTTYQSKTANWTYNISDLDWNTTYNVRLYVATSSSGTGSVLVGTKSITTPSPPSRTISASAVAEKSTQLSVTVGANSTYTTYRIGYSTGSSYTYTASSSSSSSVTRTITGLAPNTTYNLVLEVDVNGSWYQTASTTARTAMVIENVSVTGTSITSVINGFSAYSYTRTIYIQAYLAGTSTKIAENSVTMAANATTSGNITVTGLTPGTSYDIKGYIYLNGGSGSYATNPEGYNISTTASATTRFSVTAPSSGYQNDTYGTTLTVSITTVDSTYRYNQVWYRIDGSGSSYSKTTLTTSTSITLSSLTPGEIYEINVYSSEASAAYGLPVYPSPDNAKTQVTNGRATLASSGERETSITANVKLQSSSLSRKVTIDAYKNGTKYQSCSHPVTINSGDTASNVKVDGLEPNTTYDIYCYVEYPVGSGTYKRLGGFSATTQSLQGTLSVASNTETGVNWSVTGLSTNSGYQRIIYFDLATSSGGSNVYGNSATITASTSSTSNTCWKIPPSTGSSATTLYYNCYVRFDNQVNTDGKSVQFLLKSGTYTVPYVQGSISGTAVAETSITCQLTGLSSYPVARTISIDAIPTSGSTVNYSGTVSASTTSKTGIQITGLKKGTDYTVYAYIKFGTTYGPAGDSYYSLGSYTVRTSGANIDPWTWTAPNTYNAITRTDTIATQAQMTSADTALTNKQATTNFSFRVWNDLVYKVYEACTVAGRGWDTTYLTLSQTLMSTSDSTDRILTADRYNAVRNQWSSGIAKVNKNDTIYAQAHFYDLTTSLNTWINSL